MKDVHSKRLEVRALVLVGLLFSLGGSIHAFEDLKKLEIGLQGTQAGLLEIYDADSPQATIVIDGQDGVIMTPGLTFSVDTIAAIADFVSIMGHAALQAGTTLSVDVICLTSTSTLQVCGNINIPAGKKITIDGVEVGTTSFVGFSADADLDMNNRDITAATNIEADGIVSLNTINPQSGSTLTIERTAGNTDMTINFGKNKNGIQVLTVGEGAAQGRIEVGRGATDDSDIWMFNASGDRTIDIRGDFNGRIIMPTGRIDAADINETSDARLKTDIVLVDNDTVLDKLLSLSVRQFKYIEEFRGAPPSEQVARYGFVAQELDAVFPELVDASGTMTVAGTYYPDFHTVSLSQFSAMAIAGIQGLEQRFRDARDLTLHVDSITTTAVSAISVQVPLDITGDLTVRGTLEVIGGHILLDGSMVHTSDERLKTDVAKRTTKKSLSTILNLQPHTYKFTKEFAGVAPELQKTQIGLIAQEVEEWVPEVVFTSKTKSLDDSKGVDYSRLVVDLIGAVQESHHQLEQTKCELAEFKAYANEQIGMLRDAASLQGREEPKGTVLKTNSYAQRLYVDELIPRETGSLVICSGDPVCDFALKVGGVGESGMHEFILGSSTSKARRMCLGQFCSTGSNDIDVGTGSNSVTNNLCLGNQCSNGTNMLTLGTFSDAATRNGIDVGYQSAGTNELRVGLVSGENSRNVVIVGANSKAASNSLIIGDQLMSDGQNTVSIGRLSQGSKNELSIGMQSVNGGSLFVGRPEKAGTAFSVADGKVAVDGSLLQTSDVRLKNVVSKLTGSLDKVCLLNPCRYTLKNDTADSPDVFLGLVAQEVQKVFPELVSSVGIRTVKAKQIDALGVDYARFVAALVNAVQELRAQVEALKS